ncbi:MAG TPA: HAMP domain-containing sensor histidine kinase [Ktedonobacteraceae bacterium]|nr:HAMP domain-containing sensor histidine kinase [Ktedonobacteraceae bacterium]
MNRGKFAWWPLHRGKSSPSQEAGAALFQELRLRLTLWYCGVLAAALVLSGVALYFEVQQSLFAAVNGATDGRAHAIIDQWHRDGTCQPSLPQDHSGPPPGQNTNVPQMIMSVCFDQNGSLLPGQNTANLPAAFLSPTLAKAVLRGGNDNDTVDAGGTFGTIYRHADVVSGPGGNGILGVVVVGTSIQQQENDLSLLLTLMLSIGGVSLVGAGLGGLFLANRALAPARLAWSNQQRFIADAAHELRTPLTLMRADAEVLLRRRERLPEEDAELLEDIVFEANHMSTLATNMLTLARLDAKVVHREHEVVNLVELAHKGVRRVQALAEQNDITVQVEHEGDPYVIGDPLLLEQAALVLLDNAIKYNRRTGSVTVKATVQDDHALLEVRDTGIGISAEHLSHLGERFYRVDKARSREAGGTGLGLSIARSIALAHSGRLEVTSVPEQGTTVTLILPLARVTAPLKQIV